MKHLLAMGCALAALGAAAQTPDTLGAGAPQAVEIQRAPLGSGEPGGQGYEAAVVVSDNVYHVPQYLPGSPTAASVWPRAIRVLCRPDGQRLLCDGYQWTPALGRGEYLYFIPVIVTGAPPQQ